MWLYAPVWHKVNEDNKARLNILRNKIFSSANIGKLSNVSVSLRYDTIGEFNVDWKAE